MCWSVTPIEFSDGEPTYAASISQELLRAVCEPFFKQMLYSLEQNLCAETHPGSDLSMIAQTMANAASISFQSTFRSHSQSAVKLDQTLDEESTETDDISAFPCLFSSSDEEDPTKIRSDEEESVGGFDAKPTNAESAPSEQDCSPMVCKHWKSKGWCRLGSNCKFLHPEHKRGVAAPKSGNGGGISGAACANMSNTASSQPLAADKEGNMLPVPAPRRKRGGKKRSGRSHQAGLTFGQDVPDMQASLAFCYVCPSLV